MKPDMKSDTKSETTKTPAPSRRLDYRTKVTVLSTLLGVLSLTAVLGWAFSQQAVALRQAEAPLLAGLSVPTVTGLQVGDDLVLSKAPTPGSPWGLTYEGKAFPASADRVETYLKTLAGLSRERLVARDGDAKAFGLDQGYRTLKLLGSGGKVLFEVQVGGSNDLGTKAYVRLAGQKEIWETDRGFVRTLELDFNTWADLTLFPGRKEADLTRVSFDSRVETADKTVYAPFDLVKTTDNGKTKWEDRISKASTETMASWAGLVTGFRFSAFVAPTETPPSGASVGTLTLAWSDGTTTTVKLGPADGQNRYLGTEGGRQFWIADWALGQLLYK